MSLSPENRRAGHRQNTGENDPPGAGAPGSISWKEHLNCSFEDLLEVEGGLAGGREE